MPLVSSGAPFRVRPLVLLVNTTLVLAAGAAQAQSSATAQQPGQLQAVTVTADSLGVTETTRSYTTNAMSTATGLSLSPRETPQSVSVITRQQMDDRGLQTTSDALQSAPGVSVTRSDTNRYSFSARGFDIDNYQFDGLTQPNLSPWAFGESNLDLAVFDRVEVVRGATGLMTGAGNPSAAVNYVRKRPLRDFALSGGVSVGSWDFKRGYADISSPLSENGRIRGRVVAAYSDSDSYTALQESRGRTLYGVITADLTRSTELTGGVSYQSSAYNGFGSGFPLFYSDGTRTDFGRTASNNAGWARAENDTTTGFLDLSHTFANNWKARVAYSQSLTDATMKQVFRGGYPDRATGIMSAAPSFSYYDGHVRRNALNLTLSGPFQLFGREHELAVGYMRSEDHVAFPQYRALAPLPGQTNYFQWDQDLTPEPNWSSTKTQADDLDNKQSGGYIVSRFSLADPVKLIVGGRLSNWETNQNYFGARRQYSHKNEFVPYAGLLVDLNDTFTAYASYTEIFKPQNNRTEAGEILPPVTGKSYEIGLKGAHMNGLLASGISLFRTEQDNLAEATGNLVTGTTNQSAYRAVKGAKVNGLELELAGEVTEGWNVATSYTTFVAKDANDNPINTSKPRSLFKLYTTYRLPGELNRLTIGGGVDWQNRMYQLATAPGNRRVNVQQGSYALVNAMARFDFTDKVSATLNVNNLFDKKYYSQIGFYNQGWYGAPRNVMLSLRAQY
ncbi:TonB-dependent siderophore receptor @ Iron siderophore receptor protein [plant metagenome]|uniref:TonB-dependent siderophore receptor @ Iron siderophore receptor protein n=1 Tax=plant metagenome TaxID=1297885 RepID=A0A484RZ15_9ZZZZ